MNKSSRIMFKIVSNTPRTEDFSMTLEENEADEFLKLWRNSDIPFAPLSIEKIEETIENDVISYIASMKDKISLEAMWEALIPTHRLDKD